MGVEIVFEEKYYNFQTFCCSSEWGLVVASFPGRSHLNTGGRNGLGTRYMARIIP